MSEVVEAFRTVGQALRALHEKIDLVLGRLDDSFERIEELASALNSSSAGLRDRIDVVELSVKEAVVEALESAPRQDDSLQDFLRDIRSQSADVLNILSQVYEATVPEEMRPKPTPGMIFAAGLIQNEEFASILGSMDIDAQRRAVEVIASAYDSSVPDSPVVPGSVSVDPENRWDEDKAQDELSDDTQV